MKLLKRIGNSVYGPEYYQELVNKPFSYSLKYFALLMLIFGVIKMITVVIVLPGLLSMTHNIKPVLEDNFPQELEITIANGELSTNVEEPYFIKIDPSWEEAQAEMGDVENILTIDTSSVSVVEDAKKYNTAFLVTRDQVVFRSPDGSLDIESLGDLPNMVINRGSVVRFVDTVLPYTKYVYPVVIAVMLLMIPFYALYNFAYMLIGALLVWIVALIKKIDIKYAQSYKLTMHLITLPVLMMAILPIAIPFLFTLIVVILAIVNIKKKEVGVVENEEETIAPKEIENTQKTEESVRTTQGE
ncbi:DUF1189 family protein [Patescibacteria group bacterium]